MIPIKRPLVTVLIGAIIGIIYRLYLKLSIATTVILLLILLFMLAIKKFKLKYFILKRRKIILIILISIIISSVYTVLLNYKYEKVYKSIPKETTITATIVSEAKETEYYYSYEVKAKNKKFIIYVNKKDIQNLKYGMNISFEGEYQEPDDVRNYKGFNYKEYLKTKKIYGSFKASNIKIIKENDINILLKTSNSIRNKIIETAKSILPSKTSSLLIGILIGEKEGISEDITKSFSKSSLSHILAISGSHISYIILGITFLLTKSKVPKKGTHIITIILLILFMFITRFSPSVVRACTMGIIMLFAKVVYRKTDTLNSIAASLLLIIIYNPFAIKDIGLQLSYLGTLGIIYLNKPISKFLSKYIPKRISQILAVTISAQIMILPVTILNFNTISTVFIISNIIAVPIAGAIILVGYANIFIGMIAIKIAKIIAVFTHSLVQILIWIAEFTAKIPYSSIMVITPNITTIIWYYVLMYSLIKKKYTKQVTIGLLIILIITVIINVVTQNFTIHFIDVGQRRLHINKNKNRQKYINRYRRRRKCSSGISIR